MKLKLRSYAECGHRCEVHNLENAKEKRGGGNFTARGDCEWFSHHQGGETFSSASCGKGLSFSLFIFRRVPPFLVLPESGDPGGRVDDGGGRLRGGGTQIAGREREKQHVIIIVYRSSGERSEK